MNLKKLKIEKCESKSRIYKYLCSMDSYFVPRLSNYVSINDYSEKLAELACVYFAMCERFDIGRDAFYL